jgi:hypothetical protein
VIAMNRRELLAGSAAILASGQAHAFGLGKLGKDHGRLGSAGKKGTPSPPAQIGGFAIGDAGTGIYSGYTLAWGEDFLFSATSNLIGPQTPKAKYGASRIYTGNMRRGDTNILGTMYDTDPLHTGHMDANRGVPYPFNNYSIDNSVLRLQARKATAAEQTMFSATAAGINGGVRNEVAAMWHTADSLIITPGTNTIVFEARVRYTAGGSLTGWHPDIWTALWNPVNPQNGNNWNLAEGSSQYATFGTNPYTNGSPGGVGYGGNITSIYDNTNFHTITCFLRNGGNVDLYIDGVLSNQAVGVNANPLNTPTFLVISSHIYNAAFNGDTYNKAQWDAAPNVDGASIYVDWVRVWKTTGVADYAPQTTISDVTVPWHGSTTVTLPSLTALWGDGTVSEYVQALQYEQTEPGETSTTSINRFPNGITYNSGTRTITVNFAGMQDNAGAIHIALGAYKNGAVCVPATFTINRAPQVQFANITATVNNPITPIDLYTQCDVGNNLPKTINVSGLAPGVTYNSSTNIISGTPTDVNGTTTVTVTDSLGAQSVRTFTYRNYEPETNIILSRFATIPAQAECDAINAYVAGLKADGLWTNLYQLVIFAFDDAQAALINLITGNYWTKLVGAPTFTTNRGFTTNGTTTAIDSGFNVQTSGISGITNSLSATVWSLTSGQTANGGFGGFDNTGGGVTLSLRNTTDQFSVRLNDNTADAVANTGGNGMFSAVRRAASGAACKSLYKNGAKLADFTTASLGTYNGTIGIGETIGVNTFASRQWSMYAFGAARSDADETNFYNRTRTLMTALGVP